MRILVLLFLISIGLPANANNTDAVEVRQQQIETILELTRENIYDHRLLDTPEWKEFEAFLKADKTLLMDEQEFVSAFNTARKKLPFTHYNLMLKNRPKTSGEAKVPFELIEIDQSTAMIVVRDWIQDASGMVQIVLEVGSKAYENLIIDLRGNPGGTLDAAVVLGSYLTNQPMDAGVYLTRKWYEDHTEGPTREDINGFPFMQNLDFEGFREMKQYPGFRMVLPGHDRATFQGDVYVLTDGLTGSTCEPFVDVIKQQGIGTVIGETTFGGMLSGAFFTVDDSITLFLPVCDYYTADGRRIDKVGVTPHIATRSEDALDKALELIAGK
jgi:carboxyl-terminal processing protease